MPTKGGGSQNQSQSPWAGAHPYIADSLAASQRAFQQPPQFYQGQTYVGATAPELNGWGGRMDYANRSFARSPTPQFGDAVNANAQILRGNTTTGDLTQSLTPIAEQSVQQSFQGPQSLEQRNFDSQLNPGQFTPQLGGPDQIQQRSFDAQLNPGAYGAELSGPDSIQRRSFDAQLNPQAFGAQLNGPDQIRQRGFDSQLNPQAFTPGVQGPYQLQERGFDPRLSTSSFTPGFGQAGGLDARSAYQQQLSGQPDYAGVQGAIKAANDPLMRDFEQNLLPQIAGRSGISGHDTGSIKLLNRTLPELGERMSSNAMAITEGERQRALGAQERAANAVTQGGYQGYGLGLQGAGQDLASRQALAQFGFNQDLARSDINRGYNADSLNAYGMGLQGAQAQAGLNERSAQYDTNQQLAQANLNAGFRADQLQNYGMGLQGAQAQAGLNQQLARFGLDQDLSQANLNAAYRGDQMQNYGLGLQGAGQQANLNQQLAQFGVNQDLAQANLNAAYRGDQLNASNIGLQGAQAQAGLNQQGAQFGYQQDLSRAGLQNDYRNSALNLAQMTGNLGTQQSAQQLQAAGQWPDLYQAGMDPYNQQLGYGQYDRGIQEAALDDQLRRWDYQQNQPMNMAQWYANIAQGFGGLGSQTTGTGTSRSLNTGNILAGLGGLIGAFAG